MLRKLVQKVADMLDKSNDRAAGGGMGFQAGVTTKVIHSKSAGDTRRNG